jgi:hypothetical protein
MPVTAGEPNIIGGLRSERHGGEQDQRCEVQLNVLWHGRSAPNGIHPEEAQCRAYGVGNNNAAGRQILLAPARSLAALLAMP